MKVKEESEKTGLKFNIQKTKIMVSGPITSWQIDGETMETVRDFILGGSKITADGDCSHEIKRHLLLGRKTMTNLDSILKSRAITLWTKVHLVNACMLSRFSRVQLCVPHRQQPTRLLCPWDSPGKNTGVGSLSLLQGIFPTKGSNPGPRIASRFFTS